MEKEKFNKEMNIFYSGYMNVEEEIRKLNGGMKGKNDVEKARKEIEQAEKAIHGINGKNMTTKEFEKLSKPHMEKIRDNEKILQAYEKMQDELSKDPEKKKKLEQFEAAKSNIRDNAKKFLEKERDEIIGKFPMQEWKDLKDEYEKIEQEEKADPKKVKDSKYKEYLASKIKKIEETHEKQDKEGKAFFNKEYRELLKNFSRIERGETINLEEASIEKNQEQDAYMKAWDEAIKEDQERDAYNKAWDEAIKENQERDAYNKAWDEAIKENKARDELKNEQKRPPRYRDDVEITIGTTGKITIGGKTYKVPRKIMKQSESMTKEEMLESIKTTLPQLQDYKYIEDCVNKGIVDSTVINAITGSMKSRTAKISFTEASEVLNEYINDCIDALNGVEVKNKSHLTYDLKDLSKMGGMSLQAKMNLARRAQQYKFRGFGETKGRYKPSIFSRLGQMIRGRKIPKLSEINRIGALDEEIEAAQIANALIDKSLVKDADGKIIKVDKDKLQNNDFLKDIRVEQWKIQRDSAGMKVKEMTSDGREVTKTEKADPKDIEPSEKSAKIAEELVNDFRADHDDEGR